MKSTINKNLAMLIIARLGVPFVNFSASFLSLRNMKRILIYLLIIVVASSCRSMEEKLAEVDDVAGDTVQFNDLSKIQEHPIIKNYRYIPLETNEDCFIGEISSLRHHNGKFYIFDKHATRKIFVFDDHGKFLYKIDKIGRGYGEYIEPNSFDIDQEGNLYLQDLQSRKIIVYQRDSVLTEIDIAFPFMEFALTDDNNRIFLYKTFNTGSIDFLSNMYIQSSTHIASRQLKADKLLDGFDIPFNSSHWLYHSGQGISFYKRFTSNVYRIDKQSYTLTKRLYLDTPFLPSKSILQAILKDKDLLRDPEVKTFIKDITNIFENDKYLFFDIYFNVMNVKGFFKKADKSFSCYQQIGENILSNNVIYGVTDDNYFISAYTPNFFDKKEFVENLNLEGLREEERKKIESISMEDNPLLLLIDYK